MPVKLPVNEIKMHIWKNMDVYFPRFQKGNKHTDSESYTALNLLFNYVATLLINDMNKAKKGMFIKFIEDKIAYIMWLLILVKTTIATTKIKGNVRGDDKDCFVNLS